MLSICEDGHDPIVTDGGRCPACDALSQKADADLEAIRALAQVDELKEKICALEGTAEELQQTIADLNTKITLLQNP